MWVIGFMFDLRTGPFGLTKNFTLCVFVQNPGSGSCMVTSPHLSVSSSGQYTSLFLRAGPDPQASGGSLVLEGYRSSQMGLPCPFPRSSQSFPFNPPRRSCCPISGCSLGLEVRHLSPLVEKVTLLQASGVFSWSSNQEILQQLKSFKTCSPTDLGGQMPKRERKQSNSN